MPHPATSSTFAIHGASRTASTPGNRQKLSGEPYFGRSALRQIAISASIARLPITTMLGADVRNDTAGYASCVTRGDRSGRTTLARNAIHRPSTRSGCRPLRAKSTHHEPRQQPRLCGEPPSVSFLVREDRSSLGAIPRAQCRACPSRARTAAYREIVAAAEFEASTCARLDYTQFVWWRGIRGKYLDDLGSTRGSRI
jgi:hypothetical protein